jgi:hypothetical protein
MPEKTGFPVYRTLFAVQLISVLIVLAAALGWF